MTGGIESSAAWRPTGLQRLGRRSRACVAWPRGVSFVGAMNTTPPNSVSATARRRGARERILSAAYDLFSRHGVQHVGIEAIIARSGVARMTLYRHFASKDALVVAFLHERKKVWTDAWLRAEVDARTESPRERLLAVFDVFDAWFQKDDFEGCAFINVLLESAWNNESLREESARHLAKVREFLENLAADAGIGDADAFARKWHILMKGCIVAAVEGDRQAARRAREIGAALLERTLTT
jgi:AcrR family transcriptional regulator